MISAESKDDAEQHFLRISEMLCQSVEVFLRSTNPGRCAFVLIVHDTDASQLLSAHSNIDDDAAVGLMRECIAKFLTGESQPKGVH